MARADFVGFLLWCECYHVWHLRSGQNGRSEFRHTNTRVDAASDEFGRGMARCLDSSNAFATQNAQAIVLNSVLVHRNCELSSSRCDCGEGSVAGSSTPRHRVLTTLAAYGAMAWFQILSFLQVWIDRASQLKAIVGRLVLRQNNGPGNSSDEQDLKQPATCVRLTSPLQYFLFLRSTSQLQRKNIRLNC